MEYETQPPYVYVAWPSWRFGPTGESAIFEGPGDVPDNWTDAPQETKHEDGQEAGDDPKADADEAGEEEGQEEVLTPRKRGRPPKVRYDF